MKVFNGKYRLKFCNEDPHWGNYLDKCYQVIFYIKKLHFGLNVRVSLKKDEKGSYYTQRAIDRLKSIFGNNCQIIDNKLTRFYYHEGKKKVTVYYLEEMLWLFNEKYDWEPTNCSTVMFDKKSKKYYGYTNRGGSFFGIGDWLFDYGHEDIEHLYKDPKLRKGFIKSLTEYSSKNDDFMFRDLVESGITDCAPYKMRGSKKIENLEEAYQAAINISKYLS